MGRRCENDLAASVQGTGVLIRQVLECANGEGPLPAGKGPLGKTFFGGAEGTRTPDPLHAMQVRYQLRHSPIRQQG